MCNAPEHSPYQSLLSGGIKKALLESHLGFPGGSEVKASACDEGDLGSIAGLGRSPGKGKRLSTPVFWPGEFWPSHRVRHDSATVTLTFTCRILVPLQGIILKPHCIGSVNLNHWTAREVLDLFLFLSVVLAIYKKFLYSFDYFCFLSFFPLFHLFLVFLFCPIGYS